MKSLEVYLRTRTTRIKVSSECTLNFNFLRLFSTSKLKTPTSKPQKNQLPKYSPTTKPSKSFSFGSSPNLHKTTKNTETKTSKGSKPSKKSKNLYDSIIDSHLVGKEPSKKSMVDKDISNLDPVKLYKQSIVSAQPLFKKEVHICSICKEPHPMSQI